MLITLVILVILLFLVSAAFEVPSSLGLWLARRRSHEKMWKNAFPESRHLDVERFFDDFSYAFGLSDSQKYRLRPSDVIYSIYRMEYPRLGFMTPDALEYEELGLSMEEFGLNSDILTDTTTTVRDLLVAYAGPPLKIS